MAALRRNCVGYGESKGLDIEFKASRGGIRDCKDRGVLSSRSGGVDKGSRGGIRDCEDRGVLSSRSGGVGLSRCRSGGDREPGELSSDSGDEEDEIERRGSGDRSVSRGSKRKFSPIIGDGDGVSSKSGLDDGDGVTSSRSSKIAKIMKSSVEHGSRISTCSSSLVDQTCSGEEEHQVRKDKEASVGDDDGLVSSRNIRSSRWANDFDSPSCEGQVLEEEEMPKLKKNKWDESLGVETDERVWSSSRDSCSGHVTDNNDMEEDEDHHYEGGSASESDTELEDAHGTAKVDSSPRRNVNMLHGCRSVDEFERLNKINEGTYGVVYRARDKKTGEIVALKKVKMEREREGFPLTALREINILLSFDHPSIVDVKEIVVGSSLDDIFLVMEYMEHDLKAFLKARKQPFSESEVKCLMLQLLKGTTYLHDNWVLHRDLKTSNLLLNNNFELKICDFGLARQYGSPLKPYTQLVVTLSYRAPELLLGAKQYSTAIDMWSLGCIMAELLSKETLFNGKSEIDQIDKIFRILGTPDDTKWPGYSKLPGAKGTFVKNKTNMLRKKFPPSSFTGAPVLSDAGFDLLSKLLTYDPETRISAEAALEHKWFQEVPSKDKETFLFWLGQDRHMQSKAKGSDPLKDLQRKELEQLGSRTGGVFG